MYAAIWLHLIRTSNCTRWNNSIVTAVSPTGEAGVTEKTFKVRPEPVEGVKYNGPLEKYERKNLPHKVEDARSSIGVQEDEYDVPETDD